MAGNEVAVRRELRMLFEIRNVNLASNCLDYLLNYVIEHAVGREGRRKFVENLASTLHAESEDGGLVSLDVLQRVVKQSRGIEVKKHPSFILENAPRWRHSELDAVSKRFVAAERKTAWEEKAFQSLRKRYQLVEAIIDPSYKYMPIEYLYPRNGIKTVILAMLIRDGNKFIAEDLTGHLELQLDLSKTKFGDEDEGLFFEGGIFLFKGLYDSRVLTVESVKLPPQKPNTFPRGYLLETGGKLEQNDGIVFLSDVMAALYQMLSAYATSPPAMFVLCGHFLSTYRAHGYTDIATKCFAHLARTLNDFKTQYADTQFVLVPGPDDPAPATVMPRSGLLPFVRDCFKGMPNVHFASNPCRILYKGQTIVICRDDAVEKLCRAAVHVPTATADISRCFADTVWSQRHYSPLLPHVSPVLPQMDHLFYLTPSPDVLVVADKFKQFCHEDTTKRRLTINPGPFQSSASHVDGKFVHHFQFQHYYPAEKKVEESGFKH